MFCFYLFFSLFIDGFCDTYSFWKAIPDTELNHTITERMSATGVIFKDHLYGFGGIKESVPNEIYATPSFDINIKNIAQLKQINYEALNFTNCVFQKSVVIKSGFYEGCIIFYGGWCENIEYNNNSLIMYNISSNTYSQLPNHEPNPGERIYHDMFAINDIVYLYGGKSISGLLDRKIWYYNLTEKSWSYISQIVSPPARYSHVGSLFSKDNCHHYYTVFSGIYTITGTNQEILLYDLWQFSFQSNSWITITEINDYQFHRHEASVVQWKEYMIIYSGYGSEYQTATDVLCMNVDFLEYSSKWRRLILVAGQSPSYDHNLYYIKLDLSMIEDFPVPIQYYIYKYATITSCVIISLLCCCSTIKCCYKNNFLNLASISDGVVYFYSRGGATVNATPTDEELPRGLSCSQIKRINERNFNLSDFHDQNTCTICLVDFIEGDNIKLLPCQHIYHCNCIMEWLYKNSLCPLCKRSVINKKGHIMQDVEWEDV